MNNEPSESTLTTVSPTNSSLYTLYINYKYDNVTSGFKNKINNADKILLETEIIPKTVFALLAVILNFAFILHVLFRRRMRRCVNENMFLSLTVAHFIFSFSTVANTIALYIESKLKCETEVFAQIDRQLINFSMFSSIFHLIVIALERLFLVGSSFKYIALSEESQKWIILITWLLTAFMVGLVAAYAFKDGTKLEAINHPDVQRISGAIVLVLTFLLLLCFLQIISIIVKKANRIQRSQIIEISACMVTLVASLSFIIFTFPFALLQYIDMPRTYRTQIMVIVHCLLLCNSVFNPILCFYMRNIAELIQKCFCIQLREIKTATTSDNTSISFIKRTSVI